MAETSYNEVGRVEYVGADILVIERDIDTLRLELGAVAMAHMCTMIATYSSVEMHPDPHDQWPLRAGRLRLFRWYDDRESYVGHPNAREFAYMSRSTAESLGARPPIPNNLNSDSIQMILGRMSGYEKRDDSTVLLPLDTYMTDDQLRLPGWDAELVEMLYMGVMRRTSTDRHFDTSPTEWGLDKWTGAPMVCIRAERTQETVEEFHRIANATRQEHYTIDNQIQSSEKDEPGWSVTYEGQATLEKKTDLGKPLFGQEELDLLSNILARLSQTPPAGLKLTDLWQEDPSIKEVIGSITNEMVRNKYFAYHLPRRVAPTALWPDNDQVYVRFATDMLARESKQGIESIMHRLRSLTK